MLRLTKDPRQVAALTRRMAERVEDDPRMAELYDLLLSTAGFAVTDYEEPDLEKLLARGRLWGTEGLKQVRGEASSCHGNAARLWMCDRKKYAIATGWALSADGVWRQHSWALDPKGRVVETTVPRLAYFGFDLDPGEAALFALSNAAGVVRL
jgi:hypothetical protein